MSMFKRRLEGFVRARNPWSQRRELRLKVLTHYVMLLLRVEVFYRAFLTPLLTLRLKRSSRCVLPDDPIPSKMAWQASRLRHQSMFSKGGRLALTSGVCR